MTSEILTESPQGTVYGVHDLTDAEKQRQQEEQPTPEDLALHERETRAIYQEILEARARGLRPNKSLSVSISDTQSEEQTHVSITVVDTRTDIASDDRFGPYNISVGWMTNGKDHGFETSLRKDTKKHESIRFLTAPPVIRQAINDLFYTPEEAAQNQPITQAAVGLDPELAYGYSDPK